MEKRQELLKKSHTVPNLELEKKAWAQGHQHVAGVDEAGRGPIAGPVVVAAVILGKNWNYRHPLNDSKKLSTELREHLFDIIRQEALTFRIISISSQKIDELNILQATLLGMKRVLKELRVYPNYVLADGNKYPTIDIQGRPVVKGDTKSFSIAAASILAKVTRDRIMMEYGRIYPAWGFSHHKGYATLQHRKAVETHGLSPIHRRSFRCYSEPPPARKVLQQIQILGSMSS